jgi:hypothetical protein
MHRLLLSQDPGRWWPGARTIIFLNKGNRVPALTIPGNCLQPTFNNTQQLGCKHPHKQDEHKPLGSQKATNRLCRKKLKTGGHKHSRLTANASKGVPPRVMEDLQRHTLHPTASFLQNISPLLP